jgi:ribonuclease HI
MQQKSIFDNGPAHAGSQRSTVLEIYVDGAARGNPGPSGIGICIRRGTEWIAREGFYIGTATNNQAEYKALIVGVLLAKPLLKSRENLRLVSDSQLVVRQLLGMYRVKDPTLKILYERVCALLDGLEFTVCHVPREQNKCADACANKGIDEKRYLPAALT